MEKIFIFHNRWSLILLKIPGKKAPAKPVAQQQNKTQGAPKPAITITPELATLQKEIETQGKKRRGLDRIL